MKYNMGGITYNIPDPKQDPQGYSDLKLSEYADECRSSIRELENGHREAEELELWAYHQAELELLNFEK